MTREDFITDNKYATTLKFKNYSNIVFWLAIIVIAFQCIRFNLSDFTNFHLPTALVATIPLTSFIYIIYENFRFIEKNPPSKEIGVILSDELLEGGIKETSSKSASYFSWSAVQSIEHVNGNIYIFFDTMLAHIITAMSFNFKQQQQECIDNINHTNHTNLLFLKK